MIELPFPVTRLLARSIVRVRRLYWLRGLAVVGIVWVLAVVAVMTADARLVIFDDRVRWLMTVGVSLLVLVSAMLSVVLPLSRRLDFRRMAQILDARHPELEERFSTLVELSQSDAAKAGFSTSLFRMVSDLAERDALKIDPDAEFPLVGARRRLAVFGGLVFALLVGICVSPQLVGRLFVRAVAPWVEIGNAYSGEITVAPGDLVVLAGSVIRIEATVDASLHAAPTIRLSRRSGSTWTPETTESMVNGVYATTADINEREWRYRVNAGPAVTRYYHVRVSELPKYDLFTARVTYPAYTDRPPIVYSNADVSAIRAIEGSRVKFGLEVSEKGTVADFRIDGEEVFEHQMVSNRTAMWSLELVNRDGFRSELGKHPLVSFQDQAPTLVIESPSSRLPQLPPHAKIPVELTASDDVRVFAPQVRMGVDGGEMTDFGVVEDFVRAGGSLWRGKTELDLSTIDLTGRRSVCFDFVARDNCPEEYGGPHVVTSSVIAVSLAIQEWGLEVSDLRQQSEETRRLIDDAKKRLHDAESLTRQLKDDLARHRNVSEQTERKNEKAAHEAAEAEKRLQELLDRIESDERFAPLAKPLEKLMEETVKPALEKIEKSPFLDRDERVDEAEKAVEALKKAQDQIDELTKRIKDHTEKIELFEKAKDLAERQELLAKSAEQLLKEHPQDVAKLEAWKRLEEAAMKRTEELARENPDADLSEARRKMETAARKIDELKKELARADRRQAEQRRDDEAKKQAAENEARQKDQLLAQALDAQKRAEQALAQKNDEQAREAQRQAKENLDRAEALPGVKALQDLAQKAREDLDSKAAQKAQREASEAARREQELREGVRKGTKSEQDLAKLDEALRKELARKLGKKEKDASSRADAARPQNAERAKAEAREAAAREEAASEQRKAAEALAKASDEKAKELQSRREGKTESAAEHAKRAEEQAAEAAEAQKDAEAALRSGEATKGVRDMQKLANEAAQNARKLSKDLEKAAEAEAAQQAAAQALKDEQAMREAMRRGEKTAADLDALDRAYQQLAQQQGEAMDARQKQAEQAAREASDKAGRQEQELGQAALDQKRAQQAMKAAEERRASERQARQTNNQQQADQFEREAERLERQAEEAQRNAEDHLERAEATEAVKAMQKRATEAQRNALRSPRTAEKTAAAQAAQRAAEEAVRKEQEIREGMRKGEMTQDDLDAMERALNQDLRQLARADTAEAKKASDQAMKAAVEALAGERLAGEEAERLADAALQAKQDEIAAARAENQLDDPPDSSANERLRAAEDALDAVREEDAQESSREARIGQLQKSATEALQRHDYNRARDLQSEIAKAQTRALEAMAETDAAEAREAANAAQEQAQKALQSAMRDWNDGEKQQEAVRAQQQAMEAEQSAREVSQLNRAKAKVEAAQQAAEQTADRPPAAQGESDEKAKADGQESKPGAPGAQSGKEDETAAEAADKAAEAMARAVKKQAAALGVSMKGKQKDAAESGKGQKDPNDEKQTGGNGVDSEVKRLAQELKRNDSPEFFKNLFSRSGWFSIRGTSKNGVDERDIQDIPREYRDLVRRYFLKLSEENPAADELRR